MTPETKQTMEVTLQDCFLAQLLPRIPKLSKDSIASLEQDYNIILFYISFRSLMVSIRALRFFLRNIMEFPWTNTLEGLYVYKQG